MKLGCTFRNVLGVLAITAAFGCSNPPAAQPAPGVGNKDATGAIGDTGADAGANPDTTGVGDGQGTDDVADALADGTLLQDTLTGDTKPDVDAKSDTDAKDTGKTDAQDTTTPDTASDKCLTDADCASAMSFGDCLKPACNVGSGECELKPAAATVACTVKGVCGGTGTCKLGACSFTSNCVGVPCKPQAVKCGETLKINVAALGASTLASYACAEKAWDGGEKVLSLGADVTGAVAVTVELSEDASPSAILLTLPGASTQTTCNAGHCDGAGAKLTFGVKPGQGRIVVLDTVKGDTGSVTVTVTCKPLPTCGDGKCAAGKETCSSCAADCGACKKECVESDTAGCSGCPCEKCVCEADEFCCDSAWDNLCVTACSEDCGGPACTASVLAPPVCGDGACEGLESCTTCGIDCGGCGGTCGDGKCGLNEHCGSCPADCGACASFCAEGKKTPGCPGCACEQCVCAKDKFCCETAWDPQCIGECSKDCGGKTCPQILCGDGICSGNESCKSCGVDCGPCVVKCGDGTCSAPNETATSCPADCGTGSCVGKCGVSQPQGGAKKCYCDTACVAAKDCCPDIATACPK